MPVHATFGGRPRAPWHPLPLSEILILMGAISAAVGLGRREFTSGLRLVLVGIGAVVVGTIEVTWREHRAGYRSHTLLLSFLPVVVLHSAVLLTVGAFTAPPRLLNVALLAADVAVFLVLFRVLRSRFLDARARAAARR
jgi:hypothetical protein